MTLEALKSRPRKILAGMARRHGIVRWHSMTKPELVRALFRLSQAKRPAAARTAQRSRVTVVASRTSRRKVGKRAQKDGHSNNGHNNGTYYRFVIEISARRKLTIDMSRAAKLHRCDRLRRKLDRLQWDLTRDTIAVPEIRLGTDWQHRGPVCGCLRSRRMMSTAYPRCGSKMC